MKALNSNYETNQIQKILLEAVNEFQQMHPISELSTTPRSFLIVLFEFSLIKGHTMH